MMYVLLLLYTFISLVRYSNGQCMSYGVDIVNNGTYFIDDTLAVNFTFLSEFDGCDLEYIIPILVDPDENEYFCSEIPTSPALTPFLSTCPILQTEMFSGTWLIVIEGLTFANVRTFNLTVGVPTTVTATPTVIVGVTSTPSAVTSTYTSTSVGSTELPPSTTTIACKTILETTTITVFTTVIRTITITSTIKTHSTTTSSTITSTATCTPPPYPPGPDPKLQKPLILPYTTITPPPSNVSRRVRDAVRHKARDHSFEVAHNRGLKRRGPDSATVTVTETTSTATVTTTTVLTPQTVTLTTYTIIISTITPTPVTKCHGFTKVTVTGPTKTDTRLSVTETTVFVTETISFCYTTHTITTPRVLSTSCINHGGSI